MTLYTHFFHLRVLLCQLFDPVNGEYQKSKKIATDSNYLRCHGFTHNTWLSIGNNLFL